MKVVSIRRVAPSGECMFGGNCFCLAVKWEVRGRALNLPFGLYWAEWGRRTAVVVVCCVSVCLWAFLSCICGVFSGRNGPRKFGGFRVVGRWVSGGKCDFWFF